MSTYHEPVLLQACLDGLAIKADGYYIDATFGRGGHSRAILEHLSPDGRLMALDQDPEALAYGQAHINDPRLMLRRANFAELASVVEAEGWMGQVDGILADLGVSSPQLDVAARGFSFQKDGPLDMRMNPDAGQSVASWLAEVDESELARVLKHDGEERFAKRIAHALVQAREKAPITTTRRCAEIIREAHPAWPKHHDPATKSFQAMRIFINQELEVLPAFLQGAKSVLREGGRLCVISFHSLEDRIVKRFVQDEMTDDVPQGVPLLQSELDARKGVHMKTAGRGKAVKASEEELQRNPRARSARLRIMEKVNAR